MAKFYETIGFAESKETSPGIWEDIVEEHPYIGDVVKAAKRYIGGENQNSNFTVTTTISIIADQYAYDYFANIRYVKWMGVRWSVDNVEIEHPRLKITLGGVYNGPESMA